jgi:lysozyme family protein
MSLTQRSQYTKNAIILDKAVRVEGGYTNNPNDPGGPTNFGVTLAVANQYQSQLQSQFNWNGDMQSFTTDMAVYVYDHEYWQKMGLDGVFAVSALIADKCFDLGINAGDSVAETFLQQVINAFSNQEKNYPHIPVDGNVGPTTCAALGKLLADRPNDGEADVLWSISCLQGAKYINIALGRETSETFEAGWQNRDRNAWSVYLSAMAN